MAPDERDDRGFAGVGAPIAKAGFRQRTNDATLSNQEYAMDGTDNSEFGSLGTRGHRCGSFRIARRIGAAVSVMAASSLLANCSTSDPNAGASGGYGGFGGGAASGGGAHAGGSGNGGSATRGNPT